MNFDYYVQMEENPFLRGSQRLYGWLLGAYPKRHREDYGPPMQQVFRDHCRDAWRERRGWGLALLWLRVLPDLVKTSVLEHLATMNERKAMIQKLAEVIRPRSTPTTIFLRVFVIVFLLVAATTTLVTFLMPESYASTARIRIEQDSQVQVSKEWRFSTTPSELTQGDTQEPRGATGHTSPSYDPYFIQTQFEVIQSQPVLTRVISDLDLTTIWGKKYAADEKLKESEALTLLCARMNLRPVRNTSLIEIRVFSDEAEEAARIANSIAKEYRDYRLEQRRERSLGGLRVLEDRFDEQEKKVHEAQLEVDALRRELGISEADASGTSPAPLLEAETLRGLERLRIESEAQYAREEKLLQQLKKTPAEELKRILPTVAPDPQLNELLSQLNTLQQSLIQMNKDVADTHPSITTAKRQMDDLNRKIRERTDGILKGMELRVASLKVHWESLTSSVQKAKEADVSNAAKTRPYFEAKQRLDELTRFRSILNMKLASEQIDAGIPRSPLVEIVDRAVPGFHPVRPNKPLNIVCGVLGGGFIGMAAAAVIAWIVALLGKGKGGGGPGAAASCSSGIRQTASDGSTNSAVEKLACILWMAMGAILWSLAIVGIGWMILDGGWDASGSSAILFGGLFWGAAAGAAFFQLRGEPWGRTCLRVIAVSCATLSLLALGIQQGWLPQVFARIVSLFVSPIFNAVLPLPMVFRWVFTLFALITAAAFLWPRKNAEHCPG